MFRRTAIVSLLLIISIPLQLSAKGKKLVIFDTDLAGDIDDAYAMALVMTSPEIEVLGVTTADGDTGKRARVACRMLWECGRENIPVYAGRPTRMDDKPGTAPQLIWGDGFEACQPQKEAAADFIIRTLKDHPHQVTIISVGPVTNLADAIKKDPAAWKLVREVYSMFGSFYMGYNQKSVPNAEWNVFADIESAKIFMTSGVPITLAGLDVTTMVKHSAERRMQYLLRGSPLTAAVCSLYSLWSLDTPGREPTLYDPVAVIMSFDSSFVRTRKANVQVTDEGYTVVDESSPANCTIGMHVQTGKLLDFIDRRLLTQNLMRGRGE